MYELLVMDGDRVARVQPVRRTPVSAGRAPDNDLVLQHTSISGHHAVMWAEPEQLSVRDLGSRNGTFINDARVTGTGAATAGDVIRIGPVRLTVRQLAEGGLDLRPLQLVDVTAQTAVPIRSDRVRIGSDPDGELVLPDGPPRVATLLVFPDGLLLGRDDGEVEVTLGDVFEAGGRTLRVELVPGPLPPTEGLDSTEYGYTLRARLDGADGPEAWMSDGDRTHRVSHEQRATLLFLLARQFVRDAGHPPPSRGWISDDDVTVGLWGREAYRRGTNTLHVLVHRTRADLREAGFDPWFIEKRRRRIRVRGIEASVSG